MMIDYLRELNLASVFLRLTLAMFFGGMIGIEREKKRRPAGFRTYMLVCLGATLTGIISQYNYVMINTVFADIASEIGRNTDVTRIGAKVIGCVGFLGAGTIIVTDRQEVKGLTTAAGLWASACMGLAIGARLLRMCDSRLSSDVPLHPSSSVSGKLHGRAGKEHEPLHRIYVL